MKAYKKWVLGFIIINLSVFLLISMLVYILDPLQCFRRITCYEPSYSFRSRLMIPGIIKNYDYDMVIIGSSTSQNFKTSVANELFNAKSIKCAVAGASGKDMQLFFNEIIKKKRPKRVIQGIDFTAYAGPPDRLRDIWPGYLYNMNCTNFYKYFFDGYVIKKARKIDWASLFDGKEHTFDHDRFSSFGKKETPTYNRLVESYYDVRYNLTINDNFNAEAKESFKVNFIEEAKKYPEIEFDLFFPPYSILSWLKIDKLNQDNVEKYLQFRRFIVRECDMLENVKVFDFQAVAEITHDLNSYYDVTHYSHNTNQLLLKLISENKNEVDLQQCLVNNSLLRGQMAKFQKEQLPEIGKSHAEKQKGHKTADAVVCMF